MLQRRPFSDVLITITWWSNPLTSLSFMLFSRMFPLLLLLFPCVIFGHYYCELQFYFKKADCLLSSASTHFWDISYISYIIKLYWWQNRPLVQRGEHSVNNADSASTVELEVESEVESEVKPEVEPEEEPEVESEVEPEVKSTRSNRRSNLRSTWSGAIKGALK